MRILVAEDDEALGGFVRRGLETEHYTVDVSNDGEQARSLIPSLLVSMAGGMVVTRASSDSTLSVDLRSQLLSRRRTLFIAAGVMLALAAIPGLPKFHSCCSLPRLRYLPGALPGSAPKARLLPPRRRPRSRNWNRSRTF